MSGCGRTFCPQCGEEMIHRDHRRGYEASSALNQLIHREGPYEITVGDLDTYAAKWLPDGRTILRFIEHKQPDQALGRAQEKVLREIDRVLKHATTCEDYRPKLHPSSGVYILRGELFGHASGRREVRFAWPQRLQRLCDMDECRVTVAAQLWNWLNAGRDWTARAGRPRSWR